MRIPAVWLLLGTILFLGSVSCSQAQDVPAATHNASDSTRSTIANVPSIDELMDSFVRKQEIAGAVTLVANAEEIVHLGVVGYAKLRDKSSDKQERMCVDSIFWIASMSKPVTGVCVMQLVISPTRMIPTCEEDFKRSQPSCPNEFRTCFEIGNSPHPGPPRGRGGCRVAARPV